jgi:hypothetical protein
MKFKMFLMSVILLVSSTCFAQGHVNSLNSLTGSISILPGSGITVTNGTSTITIAASGVQGSVSSNQIGFGSVSGITSSSDFTFNNSTKQFIHQSNCALTPVGQNSVCGAGLGTSYYSSPVLHENVLDSSQFLNVCYANSGAPGNSATSRSTFMCLATESNGMMGLFTQLSTLANGVGANILFDGQPSTNPGSLEVGVNNSDGTVNEWWAVLDDAMNLVSSNGKGLCLLSPASSLSDRACISYNGTTLPGTTHIPTLSFDPCSIGQIAWDSNYVYVCVAVNSWKRSAISSW